MEIITYDPKYKDKFIEYNTDWIVDNFGFLEKEDKETFANIERDIADGAMIYFAVEGDVVLATCMAKRIPQAPVSACPSGTEPDFDRKDMQENTWEICKLASNKHQNHKGCGSAVFGAAMQWAIDHGALRLFILSNSRLKPAIHIYHKFGFNEIPLDDYEYIRGDIAFEKIIDHH